MADYIEREAALESVREKLRISEALPDSIAKRASVFTLASMNDSLKSIPAADAIEELSVIRDEQKAQIIAMAAEDKPRWIPVTERLPEQEKQVLVTGIEAIGNVQIYGVKQLDGDVWRPTSAPSCYWEHWMPLPQPPEEE